MSILSSERVSHSFGDNWLFKDLTFGISRGDRVALVGSNGTGKSTLLKILAGELVPNEGLVVQERGARIGYLDQNPEYKGFNTIIDFISATGSELLDRIRIEAILTRLNISDFTQKISTLSGGQRKRLALAKLLIDQPDIYILDEPTNHLDIETIEWLEKLLTSGQKTILMVTHDRYFLDAVSNEIKELDRGHFYSYNGNYAYYLEKKAEKETIDQLLVEKSRNLLKKELEWIRRQPKARGTKSKSRIAAFYDLEKKAKEPVRKKSVTLGVQTSRLGNKILELNQVSKSFGEKTIISSFDYVFKKGDRIGLSGINGSGKSTFLNLITGEVLPDYGHIDRGETTVFGYYKQSGLHFDEEERVLDVVKNVADYIVLANGETLTASQLLTNFLFPPQKQHGFVKNLSGGERKRLQLMKVLMANPNILILDEPTNDLDIDTLNVLEEFLDAYSGVLLLVSHDRYLVDKLVDQLFIFDGAGNVQIYNGNYSDYKTEADLELRRKKAENETVETNRKVEQQRLAQVRKKPSYKETREYELLNEEIPKLELALNEKTSLLTTTVNHMEISRLAEEISALTEELDTKSERWLELSEII